MKKYSRSLALALALLLALSACGVRNNDPAAQENQGAQNVQSGPDPADASEGEEVQETLAPAQPQVFTAADMKGIDPYDPNLSVQSVDYSQQPAFTSTEGMAEYFQNCIDNRCRSIVFSCSREVVVALDSEDFCNTYHVAWTIPKMQPGDFGKHYIIRVTYYPGDNVAWAYLHDDKSMLSADELALYDTAVAWLEENITEDMTDYDKCVAIHDYLSGYVQYDNELLAALNTSFTFDLGITAYGAMMNLDTICQGYADAFDMLTSMLGMNCTQIYGTGSGELHNWTMVELDGNWYHVDCTFDDMFPGNDGTSAKAYLFVSDQQMRRTHSWDASQYPEATDDSLWYYTVKDLVVTSEEELEAKVGQPLQEGRQVDVYIKGLTEKQVTDYVQSLGGQFHVATYQSDTVLCAWIP